MGKRMALLFSVLVLSGSYTWAQSLEQQLTARELPAGKPGERKGR